MRNTRDITTSQDIQQELRAIVDSIVAIVPTEEIILFGSYARGVPHNDSDLDICVLTSIEGTRAPSWLHRVRRAVHEVTAMPFDLLIWPQKEFKARACHPSSFERVILENGVRLYG